MGASLIMKKFFLTLLISLANVLPAQAQETNCFYMIERNRSVMGAPISGSGSDKYQFGHEVRYLFDRLLSGPVDITSVWAQIDGYTGAGGGTAILFVDKKRIASDQSLYPLTQDANYLGQITIANMPFAQTPSNITVKQFVLSPPIKYVPGEDALVTVIDGSPSSTPVGHTWTICTAQAIPIPPAPLPAPPSSCTILGNDEHTFFYMRGDDSPEGSPSFKDWSQRNYSIRYFGNARSVNGKAFVSGGILAPEVYAPGYGMDMNPAHIDWNFGSADFTWDMRVTPSTITAFGGVQSFGNVYSPFLITQESGAYYIYASNSGTSWNIASRAMIGAAAAGVETHLAVVRSGSSLLTFLNGTLTNTFPVSGSLFYQMSGAFPFGRPIMGAQAAVDADGNVTVNSSTFFHGSYRWVRGSKIARWTANFSPATGPYCP